MLDGPLLGIHADNFMPSRFPLDLASHVHAQLIALKERPPSVKVLTNIFETLFFASLKREEGQPISCRLAFMVRKRPDPNPPERIVAHRWQCFTLADELPLNVSNLVKLSTAVDPWGSTLAVDADSKGNLWIWGLIDQSVHFSTFVTKEASGGPEMPGIFQAAIEGTGEITAYKRFLLLGSLKQNILVEGQQRVFDSGPVHSKLMRAIKIFQQRVRKKVGDDVYDNRGHWDTSLEGAWISTLCRILIGIHRYQHGGAVLISDASAGLKPKYSVTYSRLTDALFRKSVLLIQNRSSSDVIFSKYLEKEADQIPADLYLDEEVSGNRLRETEQEITGCVRFLASLSRVDGLIWLDTSLQLKAFGVEIVIESDPESVLLTQNPSGTKAKKVNPNGFGMRHRSMLRYCNAHPDSVGFVVSQDGNVRAVTRGDRGVFLWNDVEIKFSQSIEI